MAKSSKIYFGLINCTFLLDQSCHYIYSVVIYLAKSDYNKSINNEDCVLILTSFFLNNKISCTAIQL